MDLEQLIGFGRYQLYIGFYLVFFIYLVASNTVFMVFAGADAAPRCYLAENATFTSGKNAQFCRMYTENMANCTQVELTAEFYSIMAEWRLFCDKRALVRLATSLQMLGVLFGVLAFGQLSDSFGRKRVVGSAAFCLTIAGSISSFSPNVTVFICVRFLVGLFCGGAMTANYVFVIELLAPKHRLWFTIVFNWPPMFIVIGVVAYFLPNWRLMGLVSNLASGLPALLLLTFMLESPRWLIQNGRLAEAEEFLLLLTRMNRDEFTKEQISRVIVAEYALVEKKEEGSKKYTFCHLFGSRQLTIYSCVMALVWLACSSTGYMLFNLGKLSGSLYLNMAYYGSIRYVTSGCFILLDLFIRKFGRRILHCSGVIVIIFSMSATIFVVSSGESAAFGQFVRVFNLLAAGFTSNLWTVAYLLSAELYPTPIRNLANGFSSMFARVGAILAPQILYLGDFWTAAPYVVILALSLIDLVTFLLTIPETKGKALPVKMPQSADKQEKNEILLNDRLSTS